MNQFAYTTMVFSAGISCFFCFLFFFLFQHESRLSLRPLKKWTVYKNVPRLKKNTFPTTRNKAYFDDFFIKWKRCGYDRDNLFCTFWEKYPTLMALLFFFTLQNCQATLVTFVSKINKIQNCLTFLLEINYSNGCFLAIFHIKKHPSLMPLYLVKICTKTDFFSHAAYLSFC